MATDADDALDESEAAEPVPADVDAEVVDAEVVDSEVVAADEVKVDDTEISAVANEQSSEDVDSEAAESPEDKVARERDEYLNALRQVQADFENFRKRSFKQQGDAIERATGHLVEDLLPVLDACDAGIEHGDEGVIAVFTSLLGVLEKAGLERLDPVGETFDPNAHEAVLHEPASEEDDSSAEPTVVEVMRHGYKWKERTLRAAMVKVKG